MSSGRVERPVGRPLRYLRQRADEPKLGVGASSNPLALA
jgi:hypothetical protein